MLKRLKRMAPASCDGLRSCACGLAGFRPQVLQNASAVNHWCTPKSRNHQAARLQWIIELRHPTPGSRQIRGAPDREMWGSPGSAWWRGVSSMDDSRDSAPGPGPPPRFRSGLPIPSRSSATVRSSGRRRLPIECCRRRSSYAADRRCSRESAGREAGGGIPPVTAAVERTRRERRGNSFEFPVRACSWRYPRIRSWRSSRRACTRIRTSSGG